MCHIEGYPIVRAVDSLGHSIGSEAGHDPIDRRVVILAPGAAAEAQLSVTTSDVYDRARCRPREAVAWRLGLPEQPVSVWVPREYQACAGAVAQMTVRPFVDLQARR